MHATLITRLKTKTSSCLILREATVLRSYILTWIDVLTDLSSTSAKIYSLVASSCSFTVRSVNAAGLKLMELYYLGPTLLTIDPISSKMEISRIAFNSGNESLLGKL